MAEKEGGKPAGQAESPKNAAGGSRAVVKDRTLEMMRARLQAIVDRFSLRPGYPTRITFDPIEADHSSGRVNLVIRFDVADSETGEMRGGICRRFLTFTFVELATLSVAAIAHAVRAEIRDQTLHELDEFLEFEGHRMWYPHKGPFDIEPSNYEPPPWGEVGNDVP